MKSFSFVAVLALSLTLIGCGWNPFHKIYSAMAEIQFQPRAMIAPGPPDGSPDVNSILFRNQIKLMQADAGLTQIVQKLRLDQVWAKRFKSDQDALSPQEALDHLRKVLKIEAVRGASIVKITASSEAPQEAADIANAVADNYKAFRDQEEEARNKRGEDFLRDQIAQQQKVVDDAKPAVQKAREDIGRIPTLIPPARYDSDPLFAKFDDAQRELEQQQAILDALNIHLKQVIDDEKIMESPVRIISRAVPPPE